MECKTTSHIVRVMRSTPTSWLPSLAWKRRENEACSKSLSLPLEMPATRARQNNQTEGEEPSPALGMYELFYHVTFRPIRLLKLIGNLFLEKSAKLYSGFLRGNSTVVISIYFCIVCFEAVVRELGDISNNRLKCADISGIRFPFNYNLWKQLKWNSHILVNALRFSLCIFSLALAAKVHLRRPCHGISLQIIRKPRFNRMKMHVLILKKCIALTSPTILCVLKKFVFANKQQIEAISVCWRVKQKFKGTFRAFFLFFSMESKLPEDRLQRSQSFHKL